MIQKYNDAAQELKSSSNKKGQKCTTKTSIIVFQNEVQNLIISTGKTTKHRNISQFWELNWKRFLVDN